MKFLQVAFFFQSEKR